MTATIVQQEAPRTESLFRSRPHRLASVLNDEYLRERKQQREKIGKCKLLSKWLRHDEIEWIENTYGTGVKAVSDKRVCETFHYVNVLVMLVCWTRACCAKWYWRAISIAPRWNEVASSDIVLWSPFSSSDEVERWIGPKQSLSLVDWKTLVCALVINISVFVDMDVQSFHTKHSTCILALSSQSQLPCFPIASRWVCIQAFFFSHHETFQLIKVCLEEVSGLFPFSCREARS